MKKFIAILILPVALISGCAVQPVQPEKTSLEIQAIQAKTFDADKKTVFNATMSILQDLGYIVASASLDTGFITAESPTKRDESGSAVFAQLMAGIRTENKTAVTVSIEEFSAKKTRVRLNLVNRMYRSGAYGQKAVDETPVHDPKIYENAFDKLGEAVFIRLGQK